MQEEISKIKQIKQIDQGPSTDAKYSDSDIMRQGTLLLKSKDKSFSFKEQAQSSSSTIEKTGKKNL